MATSKIYLIPGLGADRRMYEPQTRILERYEVLEHQKPLPGENIKTYAQRLSARIDTSEPFILIGTSLGGILSMEIARILKPEKVILISSVKHRGELPLWIRIMKYLRLHKLLSGKRFIDFSKSNIRLLITKRDTRVAKLLLDMHEDADPHFVEWAINEVIHWDGSADHRPDVVHIHGTKDRLFPFSNVKNAIAITGGSHVMGCTQPADVNEAILKALRS
ncbi:MAG: alpha/beta hydrolase [Bacteroidetes bacterium]|nr:alpha/beta hydrolase [Bacteroidota bacterium]